MELYSGKIQHACKKKVWLIGLFFLALLPFVSAVTLDNTVVLNTTSSNTSLTFSVAINVSNFTVNSDSILLDGIVCYGGFTPDYTIVLFNTPNTNFDSSIYCAPSSLSSSCSGMVSGLDSIIGLIGLILAVVLIGAVVGVLLTSFNVIPDIEIGESMDLKTVLTSVLIVAAVSILIILLVYIFESGLCPALGG